MQAIGFFIAGIVLHQSLTGHVFLYRCLTIPSVATSCRDSVRVDISPTILSFRSGCGSRSFISQQISLWVEREGRTRSVV